MLKMEEKHNTELAHALRGSVASDSPAGEISQLVDRIDRLTQELTEQQKRFAAERRDLQSQAALQLQQASTDHRQRLLKETSRVEVLEDQVCRPLGLSNIPTHVNVASLDRSRSSRERLARAVNRC